MYAISESKSLKRGTESIFKISMQFQRSRFKTLATDFFYKVTKK